MTSRRFAICVLLLSVAAIPLAWAAGPRDQLWKEVDEAMKKGLPKTAIEKLDPIIEGAIEDKAYAEAIKAIGQKIALEGNIQGNKPEEKITRMQAEIDKAPGRDEAGDGGDPGQLVLALLPAEPLAVHAADANGGSAQRRFHHLGPAADLCARSTSSSQRRWPRPTR